MPKRQEINTATSRVFNAIIIISQNVDHASEFYLLNNIANFSNRINNICGFFFKVSFSFLLLDCACLFSKGCH